MHWDFFSKKRDYSLSLPDEDGFVREEYYDWWYLDKNLRKIRRIEALTGYTNRRKRAEEEKFNNLYSRAVETVKSKKN